MSELTVPVIDRVIELQPARILPHGDFSYLDKDKSATLITPPSAATLPVSTLSGFIGLLELGFEGFCADTSLIHVAAYDEIYLIGNKSDAYGRRQRLVSAKALKPDRTFNFGSYMPQEEFLIAVRSMFVETDELLDLVKAASAIASNAEIKQEDDGVSQAVTARAGVHLLKEITIKPRVALRPFRTFTEVEQPSTDLIFRVKPGNLCALFEADGGAWKMTAMNTIKAWLQNQVNTSAVNALNTMKVVA